MNHNTLTTLLHQLSARQDAWQQAQALMAPLLAPHFSPFDVYQSREVDVSRHLALLLDPKGTHGQGSLFWDAWVEQVIRAQTALQSSLAHDEDALAHQQQPATPCAPASETPLASVSDWLQRGKVHRVETEHCTTTLQTRRFIDLCIHLQGQGGLLAIENKPWHESSDEQNQLLDYATHLAQLARGRPWVLVYVGQRQPSEHSISATDLNRLSRLGHLVTVTWSQLLQTLTQCLPKIQAQKVRWFVEDFIKLMEQETMSRNDSAELTHVAQLFHHNPQTVNQALLLRDSLQHWQLQQLQKLEQQIKSRSETKGLAAVWEVKTNQPNQYSYFALPIPEYKGVSLRVEWSKGFGREDLFSLGLHVSGLDLSHCTIVGNALIQSTAKLPASAPIEANWPYWTYVLEDPLFYPELEQERLPSEHPWLSIDRAEQDFVTLVFQRYQELQTGLALLVKQSPEIHALLSKDR